MSADWWKTFFSGVAVDLWLQAGSEEWTRPEVDFIVKQLGVAPPARVLDVPCGGGRHSVPLAKLGYRVTGVDPSPEFLAAARANAAGLPIDWHERDMRDLQAEFFGPDAICAACKAGDHCRTRERRLAKLEDSALGSERGGTERAKGSEGKR